MVTAPHRRVRGHAAPGGPQPPGHEVTGPVTTLEGTALLFALVTLLLVAAGGMRPVHRGRCSR